jgi:hypothetical protein
LYDGAVQADAGIVFDAVPRYQAVIALRDANFNRLIVEGFYGEEPYQGKLNANLTLSGRGRSELGMRGHGEVQVTDANIYRLPLLVSMLQVLRNETPDSTAFNQCDAEFRLDGRHIYLDKLNFIGNAVSLLGAGQADLDQAIKLQFHGVVGRNQIPLPLVKNFVDQVGKQTMQMYVDGTLSNPQVHKQALPGLNQLIQQIQTDLNATSPDPNAPPREAHRFWPGLPFRSGTK